MSLVAWNWNVRLTFLAFCRFLFLNLSRLMTKPTKWHVHPAKTQISLGIHPVWSESLLCAEWVVAKDPSFLHADSEDRSDLADDQADLGLCWTHMPFCWFYHDAAHFTNAFEGENIFSISHKKVKGTLLLSWQKPISFITKKVMNTIQFHQTKLNSASSECTW